LHYQKSSNGAIDYAQAAQELMERFQ